MINYKTARLEDIAAREYHKSPLLPNSGEQARTIRQCKNCHEWFNSTVFLSINQRKKIGQICPECLEILKHNNKQDE